MSLLRRLIIGALLARILVYGWLFLAQRQVLATLPWRLVGIAGIALCWPFTPSAAIFWHSRGTSAEI